MRRSRNSSFDRTFEVAIYEEDYKELCAHVLRKPNIETGGDLFGLWGDEYKAVVQLTLGPGERCKRTSVSFFQDVKYLEKVGSFLTQNEGLCHIGEWHSHHQLGLARPSGGDENTVWNNMPAYRLSKFVIFIANIEASKKSYKVNIGCFLFEIDSRGNQLPVLQGTFKILDRQNPFSRKGAVSHNKESEAEKLRSDENENVNIKDLRLENVKGKLPSVTMKRLVNPNKHDNSTQPENPKKSRATWNSREARGGAGIAKVPEVNVKSGHLQDSSSTAEEGNPDLDNKPTETEIISTGVTQGRPQQEKPAGSGASGHDANDRKFEVVIYEEDYKELCAHVLRKPNIETGGDLFGLWVDEYKAVVQLTLGPGQRCRRTSVSFFQDVKYLEKVGSFLTQNEGLCHIGEWHSHHQLGLARPSDGDENTVWNNMPSYKLSKFVIFIANIEASKKSYKVNIGCFLFEIDSKGNQLPVLQGTFKILDRQNPFSRKEAVSHSKESEAEKLKSDENENVNIKDLRLENVKEKLPSVTMKRLVNPNKHDNSTQPENPKKSRATREARGGAGIAKVPGVNVKGGHLQDSSGTAKEGNPDLDNKPRETGINSTGVTQGRPQQEKPGGSGASRHASNAGPNVPAKGGGKPASVPGKKGDTAKKTTASKSNESNKRNRCGGKQGK